jgi:hypothetical protein
MLPKAWQSLVVGTFPREYERQQNEVLERTFQVGRKPNTAGRLNS